MPIPLMMPEAQHDPSTRSAGSITRAVIDRACPWLFTVSGLALISAAMMIPAQAAADEAVWLRDRAVAVETHRVRTLAAAETHLAAIERRDTPVVREIVRTQLGLVPESRPSVVTLGPGDAGADAVSTPGMYRDVSPPAEIPPPPVPASRLARIALGERSKLWLIVAGGVCLLIGLLPDAGQGSMRAHEPGDPEDV